MGVDGCGLVGVSGSFPGVGVGVSVGAGGSTGVIVGAGVAVEAGGPDGLGAELAGGAVSVSFTVTLMLMERLFEE